MIKRLGLVHHSLAIMALDFTGALCGRYQACIPHQAQVWAAVVRSRGQAQVV
jgi:hypothetical protein